MYPHERSLVIEMKDKPFALIGVNSDSLERAKKAHPAGLGEARGERGRQVAERRVVLLVEDGDAAAKAEEPAPLPLELRERVRREPARGVRDCPALALVVQRAVELVHRGIEPL